MPAAGEANGGGGGVGGPFLCCWGLMLLGQPQGKETESHRCPPPLLQDVCVADVAIPVAGLFCSFRFLPTAKTWAFFRSF